MTDKEKYMRELWGTSTSNEGVFHYTIMDIAWSLHVIASMLMENNRYVDTDEYMNGER